MKKMLALVAVLLILSTPSVMAQEHCVGDLNHDGEVGGADTVLYKADYPRNPYLPNPCPPDGPAPVEKTGQTTCYDESGTSRPCAGTGEDGEHQSGVAWPNPRFTDNGDGTITDNLTGLNWLKDANCIVTNYSGFDNDAIAGDGRVTWQHALDFVAGINDGTYPDCGAGNTDWRLPNRRELFSLVHDEYYDPALPDTAGTGQWSAGDPFDNVQSSWYWPSTTYESIPYFAWFVRFDDGSADYNGKSLSFYVWPVRGGQ